MPSFIQELRLRKAHLTDADLLQLMGYRNINPLTLQRLQDVLADEETLGLREGGYDLRYSSREFLLALCRALGVDARLAMTAIRQVETTLAEERDAFAPYVFVDTDFKRSTEPVAVLGMTQHRRYLTLPKSLGRKGWQAQLDAVAQQVLAHYASHGGDLGYPWGRITRYQYHYSPGQQVVLGVDGRLQEDQRGGAEGVARIGIGSQTLPSKVIADR